MAYIPDEALMREDEIPNAAGRLYRYYCLRRNHETGLCFPSLSRTQADLNFKSYTYTSEMRSLLVREGWIELTAEGEIRPLMGFEVREKPKEVREKPKEVRKKPKDVSEKTERSSEKTERSSEKTEPSFGKNRTKFREKPNRISEISETHYKDEPDHLTSPFNQVNTKQQPAPHGGAGVGANKGGGCKACRIPDGFTVLDEMREWAQQSAPLVDLVEATAEFVDYWRGLPAGTRSTKSDWPATWRNRMRELQKQATRQRGYTQNDKGRNGHNGRSADDPGAGQLPPPNSGSGGNWTVKNRV